MLSKPSMNSLMPFLLRQEYSPHPDLSPIEGEGINCKRFNML
jgi:hypothetical protein